MVAWLSDKTGKKQIKMNKLRTFTADVLTEYVGGIITRRKETERRVRVWSVAVIMATGVATVQTMC